MTLDEIKRWIKSRYWIFKLVRLVPGLLGYYKRKARLKPDDYWQKRIDTVLTSPDNSAIIRAAKAGLVEGDVQYMHNGLRIHVGSYYGDGNTILLSKNKGVHEPQEEKAFCEVLDLLPPGSTMLELGSFWGFYSMTFLKKVAHGVSYLIEPDRHALLSGKNNFRLNGLATRGHFFNSMISNEVGEGDVPTITVDHFMESQGLESLDILHSDIQGFELQMLEGASRALVEGKIAYLFISTHSNELHEACKNYLVDHGYVILCDADLDETYSWDGVVVARHHSILLPDKIEIAKK